CLRHSDSYALTSRLPTALALLSLPDALPIYRRVLQRLRGGRQVTELQEDLLVALRRGQELHQLRGLLRVLARLRHREEGAAPVAAAARRLGDVPLACRALTGLILDDTGHPRRAAARG